MRHYWLLFVVRAAVQASPLASQPKHRHPLPEPWSPEFWSKILISAALVLAGGVFAGLTLGLMGLDELHLRVLATSSEDVTEKENAKKGTVFHIVASIVQIGGGIAAVVISTTTIVIFGIIPQAVCVRYGLGIGAKCAPLVLALMWILSPIAYPIAKLLDWVLGGTESHLYKKAELRSFLQFHRSGEEPLRDDEIAILNGVLELNTKRAETIMTPMQVSSILSGYSRFPVHAPDDPLAFVGLLLVKRLLTYDPAKALPVSAFPLSVLPEADPTINCFQALDYFQTGRAHLLLLSNTPGRAGGAIGVITLEGVLTHLSFTLILPTSSLDIIEEIISEEIVDETDRYEDNQSKRRAKRKTTSSIMRGIVERERRADSVSVRGGKRNNSLLSFRGIAGGRTDSIGSVLDETTLFYHDSIQTYTYVPSAFRNGETTPVLEVPSPLRDYGSTNYTPNGHTSESPPTNDS
ncbi:hypothetical protein H0H92_005286 [Tricholoma furcatifolium]|nr:hypothetical protein H0H92_005286 [Tricholoma furcatifolium]